MSADSSSENGEEGISSQETNFQDLIINDDELRIVMVGKTGAGKSATGNTIVGSKAFVDKFTTVSVTTKCTKASGEVAGRKVSVVDTPGLFDTKVSEDEVIAEIKQCICFASPGPHVFLVVIKLGRFTKEEQETVQIIQDIFGQKSNEYTMILLSHADMVDEGVPVEEIVEKSQELQQFISNCGGRYHVFDNKSKNPSSQVTELLEKINILVLKNGEKSHYTNAMFQSAEKKIEEMKKRILKKNKKKIQKEEEQLKKKLEGQSLEDAIKLMHKRYEKGARAEAEKRNAFLAFGLVSATAGAACGAYAGLYAGLVFGPVGLITGGILGALFGAILGGIAGVGTASNEQAAEAGAKAVAMVGKTVKDNCVTQ